MKKATGFLKIWYSDIGEKCMPTDENVTTLVLVAHTMYGKGNGNPARLNLGDSLACACSKSLGIPLIYVGDNFSHTDLALN